MPTMLQKIDAQREVFDQNGFTKCAFDLCGIRLAYYVIPTAFAGLPEPLQHFAMQMVPDLETFNIRTPEHVTLFGVSEAIAPESRELVAGHEAYEYLWLPMQSPATGPISQETGTVPCGCRRASEHEWLCATAKLSPQHALEHAAMRAGFFANFVPFAESKPKSYPPSKVELFRQSQLFWADKVRGGVS